MQRRDFIKAGAIVGAGAVMPGCLSASVKGKDRIKVGLIGCGGRGTGASVNMLNADQNIEFVAFADLFEDKIGPSISKIEAEAKKKFPNQAKNIIDPSKVQRFSGFNCVDQLLSMKEIDVVIEATPPVFRTPHYKKIVAAGKHAFLEKTGLYRHYPGSPDAGFGRRGECEGSVCSLRHSAPLPPRVPGSH